MTKNKLILGTLDMLILRVLSREDMHGWGIAERIGRLSHEALSVGEGSLYPALYRMEHRGWIQSAWGLSNNNRRAKYYRLTKAGRRRLEDEISTWRSLVSAVAEVMGAT